MKSRFTRSYLAVLAASCPAVLALACTGELTGPNGSPGPNMSGATGGSSSSGGAPASAGAAGSGTPLPAGDDGLIINPPPFQASPGLLRRLTRSQFRNAMHDVFGVDVDTSLLDPDTGQFAAIGASTVETSALGVEQYQTAIESAASTLFGDATKAAAFIGCTPTAAMGDACTRTFIQNMGRRAWRRPLQTEEVDQLASVAATAASQLGSATEGVHWATVALFASPNFLYRPELGVADASGNRRFDGFEMAGRLAFLVWNSLPDKQLLDDAASGALASVDGVRTAVNRMLATTAGRESIGEFGNEYMTVERVLTQAKDSALYPDYGPALQTAMVRDMHDTWEAVAFDDKASALSLFTTLKVTVNADLAKLYGLDATGLTSTTFKTLTLPADGPRAGILSKAGFLSQHANQVEESPTLRGKFIRQWLMCKDVPPPPAGIVPVFPPVTTPMTKRQRLEMHRANPSCAGCHALFDPMGIPLESFDAVGRYRTMDNGFPVDPSGSVDGVMVADARAMGEAMSQNKAMGACMARRFYAYAVGHDERDVDGTVVNDLITSFQASGYKLADLVVATVTHDAFSAVAAQP